MVAQLELILLGFAVVVDSVLWIALVERVNRPNTAVWLTTLVGATWCAHASGFVHVLLRDSNEEALFSLDRWFSCDCGLSSGHSLRHAACGRTPESFTQTASSGPRLAIRSRLLALRADSARTLSKCNRRHL